MFLACLLLHRLLVPGDSDYGEGKLLQGELFVDQ